jgi:hypothetical protein
MGGAFGKEPVMGNCFAGSRQNAANHNYSTDTNDKEAL